MFVRLTSGLGKNLDAISQIYTVAELAKMLSDFSGKKVDTLHLSDEQYKSEEMKQKATPEMVLQSVQFVEK